MFTPESKETTTAEVLKVYNTPAIFHSGPPTAGRFARACTCVFSRARQRGRRPRRRGRAGGEAAAGVIGRINLEADTARREKGVSGGGGGGGVRAEHGSF